MMEETGILKIRLENAIAGHRMTLWHYPEDADSVEMLQLLEDCYSVISRIKPVEKE